MLHPDNEESVKSSDFHLSTISSVVHKYTSSAQSVHVVVVVEAPVVVEVQFTLVPPLQYCGCVVI